MSKLSVPSFSIPATSGKDIQLTDFAGQRVVLYFYPKDMTPGCTIESKSFRDHMDDFAKLNTVILGVSKDSLSRHEKFKEKHCMPFELLSDEDEKLCRHFDVIKEKSLFGKKYMGIVRSTFLIDESGHVIKEWRKVKVSGHVEDVLSAVKAL